jgi:hypothetical protein
MGGRLGGWGARSDEVEESQESFMTGVLDMVSFPILSSRDDAQD